MYPRSQRFNRRRQAGYWAARALDLQGLHRRRGRESLSPVETATVIAPKITDMEMKIKDITLYAAGAAIMGLAAWSLTTTQGGTLDLVKVEKDIELIKHHIEDLKEDIEVLKVDSHGHDHKGRVN